MPPLSCRSLRQTLVLTSSGPENLINHVLAPQCDKLVPLPTVRRLLHEIADAVPVSTTGDSGRPKNRRIELSALFRRRSGSWLVALMRLISLRVSSELPRRPCRVDRPLRTKAGTVMKCTNSDDV